MRVFLDTNILLDVLTHREPHHADSQAVLDRCHSENRQIFIAVHGLATAFYILENLRDAASGQQALSDFMLHAEIAPLNDADTRRAFTLRFDDPEDALQAIALETCGADCIVTRDAEDFSKSRVSIQTRDSPETSLFIRVHPPKHPCSLRASSHHEYPPQLP